MMRIFDRIISLRRADKKIRDLEERVRAMSIARDQMFEGSHEIIVKLRNRVEDFAMRDRIQASHIYSLEKDVDRLNAENGQQNATIKDLKKDNERLRWRAPALLPLNDLPVDVKRNINEDYEDYKLSSAYREILRIIETHTPKGLK